MNAISRPVPGATSHRAAMARDLLGAAHMPPSAIAYHTMLSSLQTGGALNLVDCTLPAGAIVPRHLHADEDELVVVLSGTLEIRFADRVFRRRPGETALIPRGAEHEVRAYAETRHIAILTRQSLEAVLSA